MNLSEQAAEFDRVLAETTALDAEPINFFSVMYVVIHERMNNNDTRPLSSQQMRAVEFQENINNIRRRERR